MKCSCVSLNEQGKQIGNIFFFFGGIDGVKLENGSGVKSTHGFGRGPRLDYSSQSFVASGTGDLTPSSGL